ncbi:MAG TPA: VanZ family protein [Gemmatimonadaceae bacterium]|nr:VanZ family protein [Gemmatimonadaceae bacterium]
MLNPELADNDQDVTVASTPQLERLGRLLLLASLGVIAAATLTPQHGPLDTTPYCIFCGSLGGVDFLLNVLLFGPLGVALAMRNWRAATALSAIVALSIGIEITQFFFITGRDASIGDVLANSCGGAIGYVVTRSFGTWHKPSYRAAFLLFSGWALFWLALQAAVSYSFTPEFPASRYYGQIARVFGYMAPFEGQVVSAKVDTIAVPNFGYAKSAQLRAALQNGKTVATEVVPVGPTPKIAPILRIADAEKQEIAILAQDHTALVFAVRTGAQTLRLRPPVYGMQNVFPSESGSRDTLKLAGRNAGGVVTLSGHSIRGTVSREFVLSPATGWALIYPGRWYLENTQWEAVMGIVWIAVLVIPFGYWGSLLLRASPLNQKIVFIGALLLTLFVGLTWIPAHYGLRAASLSMWFSAAAGLACGSLFGFLAFRTKSRDPVDPGRSKRVASPRQVSQV